MVNNAFTGQHSQPQTEDKGREENEDKKKLAKELIIGWTHTKVRSQEVDDKRKAWLKSLSWAGPIPRLERSVGGEGQEEAGSKAYSGLDSYQGEELGGGGVQEEAGSRAYPGLDAYLGEESGGQGGQGEAGSRAYPGLDPYQGEESGGGGGQEEAVSRAYSGLDPYQGEESGG